jgi:type IV secretion system protein VirD4
LAAHRWLPRPARPRAGAYIAASGGLLAAAVAIGLSVRRARSEEVTRRCDWRFTDIVGGDRPTTLYLVVPPSDINRTKPLIRMILNRIGRSLTEDLQARPAAAPPDAG